MNNKIKLTTDSGSIVEADAPLILSASRSTDIPAFHSEWFIHRLRAGYAVRHNPFNQQKIYISFKNTKAVVFWSKNPLPLLPYLNELDTRNIHYYFQFTLNDYEREKFEPNVPLLSERIEIFKRLSIQIGKEKIIWRFDPLILTPHLSPRDILQKIWHIGNQIKGYTDKLVFSFIDIKTYRKVQNNMVKESDLFTKTDIENSEFTYPQILEFAEGIIKIRDRWKSESWDISLSTCAEKFDLTEYGITHNSCIDGELMKRIFSEDQELIYPLTYGKFPDKNTLFAENPPPRPVNLKDKGQRKHCGCIISKDIGMYNTCNHLCIYCYANSSKEKVIRNLAFANTGQESISSL